MLFIVQREKNGHWFDCGNLHDQPIGAIRFKKRLKKEYPGIKFRLIKRYQVEEIIDDISISLIEKSEGDIVD